MKQVRVMLIIILLLASLATTAFAAQMNGTSYNQNVIVSSAGENITGTSYKTSLAVGIIAKVINSTSFINMLGFFHTWLLANDQPCSSASQCQGGFCCSNLCKSSACPSPGVGDAGGTSGGGGGAAAGGGGGGGPLPTSTEEPKIRDFRISPGSIKEKLELGAAKTKTINLKNTGNTPLKFNLDVLTVDDFVFLSDSSFSLDSGEEKTVEANMIGKKLGSYIGEIEAKAGEIRKSISVILEVESEQALFDAKIDIPSAYKEVRAGGELKAQITLLNVGPPRKIDVTTTYIIKDRKGNAIYESSETFAVEKQASFVKSFKIPQSLQPGEYLAIIELRYENSFAVSSELFEVLPKKAAAGILTKTNAALAFIFLVFAGLIFLLAYLLMPKIKVFEKFGGGKRK